MVKRGYVRLLYIDINTQLTLYLCLNPVREGRHPRINAGLAFLSTAVSPGCDAMELKSTRYSVLVDQGAARISL